MTLGKMQSAEVRAVGKLNMVTVTVEVDGKSLSFNLGEGHIKRLIDDIYVKGKKR